MHFLAAKLLPPVALLDSATAHSSLPSLRRDCRSAAHRQLRQGWLLPQGPAHPDWGIVCAVGDSDLDLANYPTRRALYQANPAETHHQVREREGVATNRLSSAFDFLVLSFGLYGICGKNINYCDEGEVEQK